MFDHFAENRNINLTLGKLRSRTLLLSRVIKLSRRGVEFITSLHRRGEESGGEEGRESNASADSRKH